MKRCFGLLLSLKPRLSSVCLSVERDQLFFMKNQFEVFDFSFTPRKIHFKFKYVN